MTNKLSKYIIGKISYVILFQENHLKTYSLYIEHEITSILITKKSIFSIKLQYYFCDKTQKQTKLDI